MDYLLFILLIAFSVFILLPILIGIVSELSFTRLHYLLVVTIFAFSFNVKLFYPKIGLVMYFIDFILLSFGIYDYYKSLIKEYNIEYKNEKVTKIFNSIPGIIFILGLHILKYDIENVSLFTLFIFLIIYYLIHLTYNCKTIKDIFVNINHYFLPFFILGLIFMIFTALYSKNASNRLLISNVVFSIFLIIAFNNGYQKPIKKTKDLELETQEVKNNI